MCAYSWSLWWGTNRWGFLSKSALLCMSTGKSANSWFWTATLISPNNWQYSPKLLEVKCNTLSSTSAKMVHLKIFFWGGEVLCEGKIPPLLEHLNIKSRFWILQDPSKAHSIFTTWVVQKRVWFTLVFRFCAKRTHLCFLVPPKKHHTFHPTYQHPNGLC